MLCKVSNDNIFPEATLIAGNIFTTNTNIYAGNDWVIWNITTPWGWKTYKYTCNIVFYNNAYNNNPTCSFYIEKDGGAKELLIQLPRRGDGNYNIILDIIVKSSATIYAHNPFQNSGMSVRIDGQTNKYSVWIPPKDGINGKPRELEEISDKARTTIFGIHIDGTRITQE